MNPDLESWLASRPPIIRQLAERFPPGSHLHDHDGSLLWVVAYNENGGLSVSTTNPAEDYQQAIATRKPLCACCAAKLRLEGLANG